MIAKREEMRTVVRRDMKGGKGDITVRHLVECEGIPNIRYVGEMTIPPGAGVGQHSHDDETEFYVIIEGSAMVDEGQGEVEVSAGQAVATGPGDLHSLRNAGDVPLRVIAFIVTQ